MKTNLTDKSTFIQEIIKKSKEFYSPVQLQKGLLVFFYKVNCPTCQYSAPFLNRFYENLVPVLGICQNSEPEKMEQFIRQYSLSYPSIHDSTDFRYSNAFDIRVVPTIYTFSDHISITNCIEAFNKQDYERLAQYFSLPFLFRSDEAIVEYQPG